ncbi:glycosyltransferase family 4 protein [Winogradskyella endarachnes]|uniref:Glycosyltransferase n=1 Tax=Winogradskyella endarachnes TaxID=2681965 RepID=A0A6L6U6K0_9FLAO|nr:glycosyltransferase family 4 protein [Winogradskyella endarachnes]MUU77875.1 glycosyltransferase [Winogradskyella endarachnes]
MKIALITDGIYPYVMGGMQKHSYFLAKHFASNQVEVDLYHYKAITNKDLPTPFTEQELKYIDIIEIDYPEPKKFPGHYLYERYQYSERILKKFLANPLPDFVYAKGFAGWALLKKRKKLNIKVPIGVNFHGYEMFQKWPDFKTGMHLQILKAPVLYHMRKADKLFSYGGKISDIIKSKGFAKKIIQIPTGIGAEWLRDSNLIVNSNHIINFIFVGRAERRKGIIEINEVLNKLGNNVQYKFHFVGPIAEEFKINSENIIYHGSIFDAAKLKRIIDQMDILVCPSYSEGMPNVIMEGMARGCAIIATDVGAVKAMVNSENGWLIQGNIVDGLENAIRNAAELNQSDLHDKKLKSLKRVREYFTWEQVIRQTIIAISKIEDKSARTL